MSAIYRYEIPVDDQWHTLVLRGRILAVGCRETSVVEVWAKHQDDPNLDDAREYRVFGTAHQLPGDATDYMGTAVAPGGQLVWHLMRKARGFQVEQ